MAEFTRDACPPLVDSMVDPASNCEKGNQLVASMLSKHPSATVVLFAFWGRYSRDWTAESPYGKALLRTIDKLHDSGVSRIIVMGPAPQWKGSLPKLVLISLEAKGDAGGFKTPSRMRSGLRAEPAIIDRQLRVLLAKSPATYFSVLDTLCGDKGCLVRTSQLSNSFTTWDYGHLTYGAALLVASRLPLGFPSAVFSDRGSHKVQQP